MKKKLAAILIGIMMPAMLFSTNVLAVETTALSEKYNVEYKTHVQDYGWETNWKSNGDLSGTVGESKRLEALRVKLTGADLPANAAITAFVHVQNEGDLGPFAMGSIAGTEGKGQRLERITLNLINLPDHQLRYNVQVQNIGWLRDENDESTWFVGGESAGTSGKGYRLEGIKIVLVETNDAYAAYQKALAAVQEENYTSLSWIYYQADVEANVVTEADDKETILAATEAILEAQKSLVKGSDLSAYNQALASVNEVDYTPESWESYQDVVWNNYVTKDDSQAIVTAATKKIVEAQKSLQRKVNLTRYNELLAGVLESDYLPDSWAEYLQVLADNVVTAANTQTAINEAVKNIEAAQKKMVRRLDFSGYKSLLSAVKEADYTVESWATYQDVVDANLMTENNTQSQIEKAMANIAAAQNNLIKAADLSAYEAALAAVNESDYTPATWLVYQNVVKTNKVTAASGQAAIDAATEKIVAAQLKLVGKADFTAYETALAAVNQNDYTPLSWMAYQKVVTANRASAAAAQDAVDKATDKILAAQLNLVLKGDLTNYKNALAAVKQANYTTESWAEYQKVVKANGMTGNSSQSEIDLATENILAAQENLVFKESNLSAYEKALSKVKEADYTAASWKLYQQLVDANVVDAENTQTEIDAATKNILAAQANLVKKGDLTAYNIALAGLTETDYTTSSWLAYQAVVKANVRTAEDGQVKIDLSTEKILAAQQSLVKVGSLTAYTEALAAVRKENYTAASWATYQTIVNANVRTVNDTQGLIDLSTKRILDAQTKLVRKYDMSAYNALLAAVKQANYTPASWTTYQTVVKANVMTASNTTAQIQAAIEKIEAAQAKLVKVVDLTAYKQALEAVKKVEYTVDSWEKYEAELQKPIYQITATSTQTQIDEATKKIIEAQKTILKKKVNLTEYLDLLAGAVEYDYSPASWAVYQKILSNNVMTENNTQTEVNAAVAAIKIAQNNVLVRRLDYTKYDELLKATEGKAALYTDVSWGIYQKVLTENTLTKNKEIDTQTGIDKAVVNIAAAQKKLVKAGDLTAYELVLNSVKISDYTSASWDIYLKVLEANEMTKNHSQAEIDAATDKIRLAQLKLAKGGNLDAYLKVLKYNLYLGEYPEDPNTTKHEKEILSTDYTTASWDIYQKVVDANFVSGVDTQSKINTAVAKIMEAQRKLVLRAVMTKYDDAVKYDLYRAPDKSIPMLDTNYSAKSWAVYKKIWDSNAVTDDNTQKVVDAATAKILAAQKNLVLRAPQALYDKYKLLVDTNQSNREKYTDVTWNAYKKVADANTVYPENSTDEINAAIRKIEAAADNLLEVGDITEYIRVSTELDGFEYMYTTVSWKAYTDTIKKYAMTNQKKQAEIDAAVEKIKQAKKNLVTAPLNELQDYYDAINDYADRRTEFTIESWTIYQEVIANNPVNKDMTAAQVQKATAAILIAQGKLVSQGNFDDFIKQISLYQENQIDKETSGGNGKYADRVASGWDTYSDLVSRYASFEAGTWVWKSTGAKPEDITSASPQKDVDAVTAALKAAKQAFVFIDDYKNAYTAYDLAMTYPIDPITSVPMTESDYTKDTVTVFKLQQSLNIIAERVKADLSEIYMKTKNMQTAQEDLVERADVTTVNAYKVEVAKWDDKRKTMMFVDASYQYLWDQCNYTKGPWETYEKLVTDYEKILKPDNNTDTDYNNAIVAIKAAESNLRYTAKYVRENIIFNYLDANRVKNGANLETLANDALTAKGIETLYRIVPKSHNTYVNDSWVVTGAAGASAEIELEITEIGSTQNVSSATLSFTIK